MTPPPPTTTTTSSSSSSVVDALESHFFSGTTTDRLNEFLSAHAETFRSTRPTDGSAYSLEQHNLYLAYISLVESILSSFTESSGLSAEVVFSECKAQLDAGNPKAVMCIDYILACTEFEGFEAIMNDFLQMAEYDAGEELGGWDDQQDNDAGGEEEEEEEGLEERKEIL